MAGGNGIYENYICVCLRLFAVKDRLSPPSSKHNAPFHVMLTGHMTPHVTSGDAQMRGKKRSHYTFAISLNIV